MYVNVRWYEGIVDVGDGLIATINSFREPDRSGRVKPGSSKLGKGKFSRAYSQSASNYGG